MNKGLLIVVSGPSGSGKGTVLNVAFERDKNIFYSVSSTTRKPRPGEKDGVNYNYITKEQFKKQIENNEMLEWAEYCDNYYGTPEAVVEQMRNAGKDVLLEIEYVGAMQVKKKHPDAILIFTVPPTIDVLYKRLTGRGTESQEVIDSRMAVAKEEITHMYDYDYIVVNGEIEQAVCDFLTVINAQRLKSDRNPNFLNEVLNNVVPGSK